MDAIAYEGRAEHVWPPFELGWVEVPKLHDPQADQAAHLLLGKMPVYHYVDQALERGLFRFFKFETPTGEAVGALKFVGAEAATRLGALVLSDSLGNSFSPVSYGSPSEAAHAMNQALIAHGYVVSDMPIYAGFQQALGLPVDGYPGSDTYYQLLTNLSAMKEPMTSAPNFPWKATTPSGATGQAAYDGTNAPLWVEWIGNGTGPAPAKPAVAAASSAGSGVALTLLSALVIGGGALIAKSAGVIG